MKKYRIYLEGQPFTLRTDNRPLLWLNTAKEEKSKFMRWALQLQEFSFNMQARITNCQTYYLVHQPLMMRQAEI